MRDKKEKTRDFCRLKVLKSVERLIEERSLSRHEIPDGMIAQWSKKDNDLLHKLGGKEVDFLVDVLMEKLPDSLGLVCSIFEKREVTLSLRKELIRRVSLEIRSFSSLVRNALEECAWRVMLSGRKSEINFLCAFVLANCKYVTWEKIYRACAVARDSNLVPTRMSGVLLLNLLRARDDISPSKQEKIASCLRCVAVKDRSRYVRIFAKK